MQNSINQRHVVIISADAMVYEDLALLSRLSALKSVWERTARVDRVRSVYPTITYPCHATMMTGVYPDRHGIVNNEQQSIGLLDAPWVHMRESVKADTIFDAAFNAGLTTASVFWPVTGRDPSIQYLIDEYWPQSPEETTRDCFRHSGSSREVLERIVEPNLRLLEGRNRIHPWCDDFVMRCAADMLRTFKPNLLAVHPANIDGYRHETGVFSDKVTESLYDTNLWLELLFKAADDAGIREQTDFFLVSDHGQMNVQRSLCLNVLLAQHGLIDVDRNGYFRDWRAFCKSGGMSAVVYLKEPQNEYLLRQVHTLLEDLCESGLYGISRVFTAEEARVQQHYAGEFSFVVETDGITAFGNDWRAPLIRPLDNSDYRFGHATHGYLPEKGPQPTLVAWGPHIRAEARLENARLIDLAPTVAQTLGLALPQAEGRCLTELLAE